MRKKHFAILRLLVLTLAFCTEPKNRTKPFLSDITESVYASAVVKAEDQYDVFPTVSGILQAVRVKAGDSVKKGDTLFIVDNNTAGLNAENSRLSLQLAEENSRKNSDKLRELDLNVRLARDKYLLDSSLYIRQKRLWDQQIGTRLDYEQRRLAFISSKNNYQVAGRQLGQMKTQLQNELEKARISYDISRKLTGNYIIRSSVSGKVFNVLPYPGDLVTTQTRLAVVGKADSFYLEMQVDENDIVKIRREQPVEITFDSYKGQVFEGRVERIYPIMNEQSRTFKVNARFVNPPPALYPNLSAEANIIIQTKKKALIIPRSYLDTNDSVWISRKEKRKVRTGLKDYRKVEILQGLDTTQFIYKPPK